MKSNLIFNLNFVILKLFYISLNFSTIIVFIYLSFIFHYLLYSFFAPVILLKIFEFVTPFCSIFHFLDSSFSLNIVDSIPPFAVSLFHMIVYYDINYLYNSEFAFLFNEFKESPFSQIGSGEKPLESAIFNMNLRGHIHNIENVSSANNNPNNIHPAILDYNQAKLNDYASGRMITKDLINNNASMEELNAIKMETEAIIQDPGASEGLKLFAACKNLLIDNVKQFQEPERFDVNFNQISQIKHGCANGQSLVFTDHRYGYDLKPDLTLGRELSVSKDLEFTRDSS